MWVSSSRSKRKEAHNPATPINVNQPDIMSRRPDPATRAGPEHGEHSRAQNTQISDEASSYKNIELAQNYAALQKEYRALVKEVEVQVKYNGQLKDALDRAEWLLRPKITPTFPNSSATLPLLKDAVHQVQVAATTCAGRLLSLAESHSLTVCDYLHISKHHFDSASARFHFQVALQASFLCEVLFYSFESQASFGGDIESNYQPFEKPQRCRQQCLEAFHKLRVLEDRDICMLPQQDAEFNGFIQTKEKLMESKLRKLVQIKNPKEKHVDDDALGWDQHHICDSHHEQLINKFFADLPINRLYKIGFLRLAKAVWQLHKLAFAFEPSSEEIFRISPGSVYDEEYMQENEESMTQAKEWDKMEAYLSEKHVLFMSLPGFTVSNFIFKSLVFLIHS